MVDKYVKCVSNGRLYVCFVDFSNAFPSVCRSTLFYKLVQCNIGGNFLRILRSMYSSITVKVKSNSMLGSSIQSRSELKQVCVLSPLVFNIFTRDLPNIFRPDCNPDLLGDRPLSCLMYADDLIIFSRSSPGLHNCFHRLDKYCREWCPSVNLSNTKIMIFNEGRQ